ncbi:RmlC-like cupin domain-containing protein [Thelonectria olida]|uniref:RmlC-like cupin domain-containing protein n=1 Tax=Thelonectria olida TaxID=1576542 RepID=A0A9P9AP01_9HYPO|nr:RmlC-like cupin domain-containing protein [Thelonectria olida]
MHFSLFLLPLCSALHLPDNPRSRGHDYHAAEKVIQELNLQPSSEKGYFVQTFQDPVTVNNGNRSASTAIYYLLEGAAGHSLWHKLDAAEVWHYYAGAPLILSLAWNNGSCVREHVLGSDLCNGQRPQAVVSRGEWQRSRSLGDWTLVGTTVAPGFEVSGQVLQPEGWEPRAC